MSKQLISLFSHFFLILSLLLCLEREKERKRERANWSVIFDSELKEMTLPMEFS